MYPAAVDGTFARRLRRRLSHGPWTRPTSTQIGLVVKSAVAAGVAWAVAGLVTGVGSPVLASLSAIVVVQVSVRSSVRTALERSLAVVLGVLAALAISRTLDLTAVTVTLLVAASLGVAELVLRLPRSAARQVPVSILVVLAAADSDNGQAWHRVIDTIIGAAIGVVVSLAFPASRLVDARQTIDRLAESLANALDTMGTGLQQSWSTEQTESWRHQAHMSRGPLVEQAVEAVGNGRESARWNVRDRRHIAELTTLEELMPRLERTAIGVSVIARGLDDYARITGTVHKPMKGMGELLIALAAAVRAVVADVLDPSQKSDIDPVLEELNARRDVCRKAASRRARLAIDVDDESDPTVVEGEWLNYAAVLVQVDRIVADRGPPPL
jgi:uncharacterized membrane protein YgaE (UPF0421/DUF939 family)